VLSEPRSSLPLGVSACQLSIESESLNLSIILTAGIGILFPGVTLVQMTGADVPKELRSRDPEFIRAVLPTLWLASTVWFRAEVHGFENVPDEPVLFVGNHSGGGATPDTFVLLLAYNTFFTVEGRPLYALAHDTITAAPVLGRLTRKLGVVPAANSFAEHIFESGGSALVYPGGDLEALRPWRDRNKIVFSGRKGFLKLAHRCNVKIVPVVATGGHDTLFVLNDGRRTAQLLRLDKLARVKSLPLTLSVPWGWRRSRCRISRFRRRSACRCSSRSICEPDSGMNRTGITPATTSPASHGSGCPSWPVGPSFR
jgi:1-acyl-sn-glycerol-3-phosphate acyltransferase